MRLKTFQKFKLKYWWKELPIYAIALYPVAEIIKQQVSIIGLICFFIGGLGLIYLNVQQTNYVKEFGTKEEREAFE